MPINLSRANRLLEILNSEFRIQKIGDLKPSGYFVSTQGHHVVRADSIRLALKYALLRTDDFSALSPAQMEIVNNAVGNRRAR